MRSTYLNNLFLFIIDNCRQATIINVFLQQVLYSEKTFFLPIIILCLVYAGYRRTDFQYILNGLAVKPIITQFALVSSENQ
jgi:hypothetical protein